jgi:8-amino-7-oxononanoate synthase
LGISPSLSKALDAELRAAEEKSLYRSPDLFSSKKKDKSLGPCVDFSSNDYLGLSHHPAVLKAASAALRKWGSGSGASRLLSGNLKIHSDLESSLARFKKEEACAVFSSGYLANLGALRTLAQEKDVVILDRLCHASLIDGARLSRAKFWVYEHRDVSQLAGLLARARSYRRRMVVTDAYFSMDGDIAPLPELTSLCEKTDSILMIDEAHSTGVYGKSGRGLTEHFGVSGRVPVVMGTLSKALGSVGGFIAGNRSLRESIVNFCRPYIYTTAPSPAASAAALAAVKTVTREPSLRKRLWENVGRMRAELGRMGLDLMGSEGPILPIRVGDPARVLLIREKLKQKGFIVSAIRPPSVPGGTERIRISISAAHSTSQINRFLETLKKMRSDLR